MGRRRPPTGAKVNRREAEKRVVWAAMQYAKIFDVSKYLRPNPGSALAKLYLACAALAALRRRK